LSGFPQQMDLGFARVAAAIAIRAGELVRGFYDRGIALEYKGDVDIVTEADRASEKFIMEQLGAEFPEHGIFGEEGTRVALDREYRWYVDPLDGTTNFAHGFPFFCISLGLEHRPAGLAPDQDGTLIAGVVYDPLRDELFAAERQRGAWLNGRQLHVSLVDRIEESLLATGFPSRKRHASPNIHFYQQLTLRSHGVRRAGAAALDLAYCAAGRLDAYWEFNLNPWDTAAGALLVEEAGGTMTGFDGAPFRLESREILATNGRIKETLVALFSDMFAGREIEAIPTPAEFAARRNSPGGDPR
jgi:myo-inositol-1(or 4)-monophosphatase